MGDGTLLMQCAEVVLRRGHSVCAVVSDDAAIAAWAVGLGLRLHAAGSDLAADLADLDYDWFFSVANLRIVPRAVWGRAARGAANFHDGPLPRYAGLNVPAWAILNGETAHGITWHALTDTVDGGAIYVERAFELDPDETAFSLNARCMAEGLDGFREMIERIEAGPVPGRNQDPDALRSFGRHRRPADAGLLRFDRPAFELDCLVRALDFGPGYANPLLLPKIWIDGCAYGVGTLTRLGEATVSEPGTVLQVDAAGLTVAARDLAVRIEGLTGTDGATVSPVGLVRPGSVLPRPAAVDLHRLDQRVAETVRHEAWALDRLARLSPLQLPELRMSAPQGRDLRSLSIALPQPLAGDRAIGALAAYAVRTCAAGPGDVAYSDATVGAAGRAYPGLFAAALPLRLPAAEATVSDLERAVAADLADLRARGTHMSDLPRRFPGIAAPAYPLGFALAAEPSADHAIPGCAVTLVAASEGGSLCLVYDPDRLSPTDAEAMGERIAVLARAFVEGGDAPVADLPLMTPETRAWMLEAFNDTERAFDAAACVHTLIERQVDRTPDAIALVCGDGRLSYRELDARANRAAHVLRGLGVGPDQPVGLYIDRGLDLVIGALAIQKAGGAYVPLDPHYPAERLAFMVADSGLSLVLTQDALAETVPGDPRHVVRIERALASDAPCERPSSGVRAADAAYVIYTSGSTGRPKGVVVEHRNVANFFTGMDERVARDGGVEPVWLAVTSLSFDIAVLELFWTLSRGITVVVSGPPAPHRRSSAGPMAFSLFHWGQAARTDDQAYRLLLESARFADANGFAAVWTPERHFNDFGGAYPNPAVTGAAVAAVTSRVAIRAGSCVLPLHHPARVAEEWAVVDNLSGGRVGVAFASGWMPEDFLLRPENAPPHNKDALLRDVETVRRLWRGEAVAFPAPGGRTLDVCTQPRPIQRELPVWITTAGNPETFREAARLGANVLTHLLGQSIADLAAKIAAYRAALVETGRDPAAHTVTVMLHTLLGRNRDAVRAQAREPMRDYLRSAAGLIKQYAWDFPAFKRPAGATQPAAIDLRAVGAEEMDAILDFAFDRYFEDSGLFGTVDDALTRVDALKAIGVDEIACLIDFGLPTDAVLDGLKSLAAAAARCAPRAPEAEREDGIGSLIRRHAVTHMQCTPSLAALMLADPGERAALAGLAHLHLGGEALPGALVADLRAAGVADVINMYGPTETTIWSSTQPALPSSETVPLGRPIANTRFYALDPQLRPVPPGCAGELYIGGAGVARGYLNRPDLTAERFLDDPFAGGGRLYRTGDLVRFDRDGTLRFLGRVDDQVKLRGHRIELGEIEAMLLKHPGVRRAAVLIHTDARGDQRLVACVVPDDPAAPPSDDDLRAELGRTLPDVMVPAQFARLDSLPLTPNGKLDRKALTVAASPAHLPSGRPSEPGTPLETTIAELLGRVLGVERLGPDDNFFQMGGHSLLAVQAHQDLRSQVSGTLRITDLFRFPTARMLARHVAAGTTAPPALVGVTDRAAARRETFRARGTARQGIRGTA
ncbi:LLM class flavin-dependent oxidoreductase [Methylobacterium sp. NEAU 140]|uniref:MupA/Atu3671 family FMN-dependent luciferase-like monooxygenase n=1 Tax=Methylobacterium sp. NEAU 140 TaxID=3064945 RepID=UPI0027345475|nr:MupA/Atu3671 family FMN-dependent luciferase-like monooxygenase [Methylobacterium sp. NEAU 140]MDP4023750.1 LLM class flavin-dependent oxidoreductase [Methylobacterium sp. NEAU 140]